MSIQQKAPAWPLVVGVIFLSISLIFFIALVFIAVLLGKEVPYDSRFLVVIILSLTTATGSGFLGGYAEATGKISIPLFKDPLTFGITGGIAVLIIILIFGHLLYSGKKPDDVSMTTDDKIEEYGTKDFVYLWSLAKGAVENPEHYPNDALIVRDKAPALAKDILKILEYDKDINPAIRMFAYSTVAGCYVLAFSVPGSNEQEGLQWAEAALAASNDALKLLESINHRNSPLFIQWASDNKIEEQIRFYKLAAISYQLYSGKIDNKIVVEEFNKFPCDYWRGVIDPRSNPYIDLLLRKVLKKEQIKCGI